MGLLRWMGEQHCQSVDILARGNLARVDLGGTNTHGDPVAAFVESVLQEGIANRASDIHIEPWRHKVVVRYSIDGVLRFACEFPKSSWSRVCARTKVLADMDVAQSSAPQSGRISIDGMGCDFRVSSHPTIHGENLVLRVLRRADVCCSDNLGFSRELWSSMVGAVKKVSGIVLVTGLTGSGKTTTVHALLRAISNSGRNIMTLEDPVEYEISNVRQTSVQGGCFESGLRSILRQNPGVIFVGEIRDRETAQLAFRAARTGRLVISTLHTTSALHSLQRLADFEISSSDVEENLLGILSQRLLRKRCCDGCPMCFGGDGYRGRVVVPEWIRMTEDVARAVFEHKLRGEELDLRGCTSKLRLMGIKFMQDIAFGMVDSGTTTQEEVEAHF